MIDTARPTPAVGRFCDEGSAGTYRPPSKLDWVIVRPVRYFSNPLLYRHKKSPH